MKPRPKPLSRVRRAIARASLNLPGRWPGVVLYALGLPPVRGGDGEDDEAAKAKAAADAKAAAEAAAKDKVELSRADHDNLQRKVREAEEKAARLEREEDDRKRKAAEDEGKFKDLYESEKQRREAAEQKATETEAEAEKDRRRGRVERIARRLKFRDATDVQHLLSDDQTGDDAKTEAALKALAEERSYLIEGGGAPNTRDATGGDGKDETNPGGNGTPAKHEATGPDRLSKYYADKEKAAASESSDS